MNAPHTHVFGTRTFTSLKTHDRPVKSFTSHYLLGDNLGAPNVSNAVTWVDRPFHVLPAPGNVSARTRPQGYLLLPQDVVHLGNQPCNEPYLGNRYHLPLLRQGILGLTASSAWVRVLSVRSSDTPLPPPRVTANATGIKVCGEERLYRCAYGKSLVGWSPGLRSPRTTPTRRTFLLYIDTKTTAFLAARKKNRTTACSSSARWC